MPCKDPEKRREYDRKYYQEHKEEFIKRAKHWRENNPERYHENRKIWFKSHKTEKSNYDKKYREANKQRIKEQKQIKRLEGLAFSTKYKKEHGCAICGEKNPAVLEFHHRDPNEKEREVATLAMQSRDRIMKEINKCDVLCTNCHKRVHAKRRGK